ncbi:SMI1/KNR4 family protein [Pseudomonas sp.]|uniref:SMI1/KNR4 family protein n=1 Tax=Pseudomonas sp. TaxID=306 RepID=UPI002913FCB4|nr:SMI1/KNR4 family protein [Pseudomonas sp.]MDU4251143.1 SMI1/KNR4 family protein [Pseudomonas sp.]
MPEFTAAQQQLLRDHRLAWFAGRIIHDAQPPISDAQLAEVQLRLGSVLPPELVALWRCAFGGRLDYELCVDYDGHLHPYSFNELFYPDSDGYRDLWGWLEHEQECAEEVADENGEDWNGRVGFLPIGGFEYLERVYVCVEPEEFGAIYAWSRALPPAWPLRLHEDALTRVADDLYGLFALLGFDEDPFVEGADAGQELLEALDELAAAGAEGETLARLLHDSLRPLVRDWRMALEQGRLAAEPELQRLALMHAVRSGDIALLERLRDLGCDLGRLLTGGGNAPVHARVMQHDALVQWFAAQGIAERQLDQ